MLEEEMKERDLYIKQREYKIIRLKQVVLEMDDRCETIENDLKILEECLNLLFPSVATRSVSSLPVRPISVTEKTVLVVPPSEEIGTDGEEYKSYDTHTTPTETNSQHEEDSQLDGLRNDYQHILDMIKRSQSSTADHNVIANGKKQEGDDSDESEWEDGSILDVDRSLGDSHPDKRRRLSMFETISEANLGGINYTLVIMIFVHF
jgi:hypothetical protein